MHPPFHLWVPCASLHPTCPSLLPSWHLIFCFAFLSFQHILSFFIVVVELCRCFSALTTAYVVYYRVSLTPDSVLVKDTPHTRASLIPPWEEQCEWHRMATRGQTTINSINTHTRAHTHTHYQVRYHHFRERGKLDRRRSKEGREGTTLVREKHKRENTDRNSFFPTLVWFLSTRARLELFPNQQDSRVSFKE